MWKIKLAIYTVMVFAVLAAITRGLIAHIFILHLENIRAYYLPKHPIRCMYIMVT